MALTDPPFYHPDFSRGQSRHLRKYRRCIDLFPFVDTMLDFIWCSPWTVIVRYMLSIVLMMLVFMTVESYAVDCRIGETRTMARVRYFFNQFSLTEPRRKNDFDKISDMCTGLTKPNCTTPVDLDFLVDNNGPEPRMDFRKTECGSFSKFMDVYTKTCGYPTAAWYKHYYLIIHQNLAAPYWIGYGPDAA